MTLREIIGRLTAWRRRETLDRALSDELNEHLHLLARDFEQEGMTATDARAAARRQLGNVTSLREESRAYWGFPAFEHLMQDLRYALRGLRRAPGFTAAVVITLGLGIGANAAMFGVIDRLMFRPFPYLRDPATVHRVYLRTTFQGRENVNSTFPYTRYLDLKSGSTRFAEYAAQSDWRFAVGIGDASQVRKVTGVSASFFGFFDAVPVRGRYFLAEEDRPPIGAQVAVISHAFWRNGFDGREVVGEHLKVGMLDYTIIGVAPEGFVGTVDGMLPDVFVPITTIPANLGPWSQGYDTRYNWDWVQMLVRRADGVPHEAASLDLSAALIRSRAAARAINPHVLADSIARPRAVAGPVRTAAGPGPALESRVLLWVGGVAVVVLLIACASVANLMLARVIRRRREVTVRIALGVSRSRLVSQFVTEALLLALLGCVAGLLLAQWSGSAIQRLVLPTAAPFTLVEDWRTIGAALVAAVVVALITTIGPSLAATRTDIAPMLKAGVREGGYRRSRLQTGLLLFQISLSVVLLVGAGAFVRSFTNARAVPLGYDAAPVIEVIADPRNLGITDAERGLIARRLLAAAEALPGVEAAAMLNSRLFSTNTAVLRVPGIDSVEALGRFNFQLTSPGYFAVMRTRILRGRGLEATDRAGTPPVALVSEAMGGALWPGRDPIGQCIHVGFGERPDAATAPCTAVVGIAENTAQQNLTDDPRFMYYLPADQVAPDLLGLLLVRVAGPEASPHLERVRRELNRAMPGDGFVVVRPLQEIVDDQSRSWRLGATMFVALGGLALVVAVVGLYGVVSYGVAGRMHELSVRVALGARPVDVVRLVVGQGVRLALIGVALGLLIALGASRWVQPLLFGQSATDPVMYAGVGAAMVVVAITASLIPARRAARADPNAALRAE